MNPPAPLDAPELPPELGPLQAGDPALIGPYRVVGRLGQGGMGTVFGALDERDACIAVKVVHAQFAADPEFRAQFATEIDLMRQVGGVCTAEVHAADATADQPWVATDFVPGQTLQEHVREHGPLEGDMLTAFVAGIAESLAAIHSAGVVHCDLKPSNVILAPESPKVLDFGIARHVASGEPTEGPVFGSPGWMSPERYDGITPTPAADVFAWGTMVAFAATGRNPFGAAGTAELARRARQDSADLNGVPADLLPLVDQALAKDPAARPSSDEVFREVMALMASSDEIRSGGLPALTELLRTRLAERWLGIDAGWHRPALWVSAATATGLAATASTAAGTGAGAAGAGAVTAAGAGTSGVGAATVTGASMGTGKAVAVVAAAVIGTAAVGTGGYFAIDTLTGSQEAASSPAPAPSPSTPAEFVALAADLVENADSLTARQNRQETVESARQHSPDVSDEQIELMIALGARTSIYSYTNTPGPTFEEIDAGDGGGLTYQNVGGDLYIYNVADDTWTHNPAGNGSADYDPDQFTVQALAAPLRAAAEAPDLTDEGTVEADGGSGTLYSGTFDVVTDAGTPVEQTNPGTRFELVIGSDGYPLRLEYTTDRGEYELVFDSFGEPVTIETPDRELIVAGGCGSLSTSDGATVIDVRSQSPGVTCEEAMDIAEGYLGGHAEADPRGSGSGGFATLDGWTCGWATVADIQQAAPGEPIGGCTALDSPAPVQPRIDFLKVA